MRSFRFDSDFDVLFASPRNKAANRISWTVAATTPQIKPTTKNTRGVRSFRSIQRPKSPGTTISREMAMIWLANAHPKACDERSSIGSSDTAESIAGYLLVRVRIYSVPKGFVNRYGAIGISSHGQSSLGGVTVPCYRESSNVDESAEGDVFTSPKNNKGALDGFTPSQESSSSRIKYGRVGR